MVIKGAIEWNENEKNEIFKVDLWLRIAKAKKIIKLADNRVLWGSSANTPTG